MMKTKTKKSKRLITLLLCVVVLCSFFVISASAFSYYPSTTSNTVMFVKDINTNQIVAYGYKVGGTSFTTTQYAYDLSLVVKDSNNLSFVDLLDSSKYLIQKTSGDWIGNAEQYEIDHLITNYNTWKQSVQSLVISDYNFYYWQLHYLSNAINESSYISSNAKAVILSDISDYFSSLSSYIGTDNFLTWSEGEITSIANSVFQHIYLKGENEGFDLGFENGLVSSDAYQEGFDNGKAEGLQQGFNTGYTQGGKDADYMENTLITIFSSPYYILNEVFNFELFGINMSTIIMTVISIILIGFVIKLII